MRGSATQPQYDPYRYDNNQGRFDLAPRVDRRFVPTGSVFSHPNRKPTREDMYRTVEMMRAKR